MGRRLLGHTVCPVNNSHLKNIFLRLGPPRTEPMKPTDMNGLFQCLNACLFVFLLECSHTESVYPTLNLKKNLIGVDANPG